MKKIDRIICLMIITIIALMASSVAWAGSSTELMDNSEKDLEYSSLEDLDRDGVTYGVITGAASEIEAEKFFQHAKMKRYGSLPDLILAMKEGKVDAVMYNETILRYMIAKQDDPNAYGYIFSEKGLPMNNCYAISRKTKVSALKGDLSDYIKEMKADGTIDDLLDRWVDKGLDQMPKIAAPEDPTKHIVVGILATAPPNTYMDGDKPVGFDIEVMQNFALKYGYDVEYRVENDSSMIADLETGKIDMLATHILDTPERAQVVDFTESMFTTQMCAIVHSRNGGTVEEASFLGGLADQFEKTFLRESRYKLILQGLLVTIIVALGAILLGTLLGILFVLGGRGRSRVIRKLIELLCTIIRGIPMLLTLMICFYIIFASTGMSDILVAIIAFALDFGVHLRGIIDNGINGVAPGEVEAAYALGMNKGQVYRKVILPQAVASIMPLYSGQIVTLVKATAIVGYISLQDLTKASDIIRARTYEAFFPLIVTAVLYFILARLLVWIVQRVSVRYLPIHHDMVDRPLPAPAVVSRGDRVNADETIIRVRGLTKAYDRVTPFHDVDFDVKKGEIISIIGPSGTGKSTLLRMLNRIEDPTAGEIYVHDENICQPTCDLSKLRANLGMVFQSFNLFSNMTVLENVTCAPMLLLGQSREEAEANAVRLLNEVGMGDRAFQWPEQLSGGQRQRVAIARALAMDPEILLFDEPTSALDPKMVSEVLAVLNDLAKKGMTMMIVTHQMSLAEHLSTRIFYMDKGGICEDDRPEVIFHDPKMPETRSFIENKQSITEVVDYSTSCDIIEVMSSITDFAKGRFARPRELERLEHILEEILSVGLPGQKEIMDGTVSVRYSCTAEGEGGSLSFRWRVAEESEGTKGTEGTRPQDPLESMDEISRKMVEAYAIDHSYRCEEGESWLDFQTGE